MNAIGGGRSLRSSAGARGNGGLELTVLEHPDALAAIEQEWDALVLRASGSPFTLAAYLVPVWAHLEDPCLCLVARQDGELVGGLPLVIRPRLGARQATLLSGARGDLLCDPQGPAGAPHALLDAVRSLPVDVLSVYGVRPDSQFAHSLRASALRPQHELSHRLDMPDGWEPAYRELVSSKTRSEDRRKLRRLSELGELSFSLTGSGPELQQSLGHAFDIYRQRWRGRAGEAGGFATREQSWRAVAAAMGDRGRVHLVTLTLDGTPIAFAYSFLFNGTLWGHRLAFDSELTQYSPGWLTIQHAIAAASDAGARRVDFGHGNESYKSRLSTSSVPARWGTAVWVGARGWLASEADELRFTLRQAAKQQPLLVSLRDRAFRARRAGRDADQTSAAPVHL